MNSSLLRPRFVESCSLWLLLAIAAAWLFQTPYTASNLDVAPDSVEYAVGALQLLETGRYEIMVQERPLPPRYPPWFSAVVVLPAYLLFGADPGNGVLPITLLSVAGIGFAWAIGKRISGIPGAVLSALAVLAIPTYSGWAAKVMTDVPCTALMLANCLIYLRVRSGEPSARLFLAAGTLAALTTLFRPVSGAVILPFLVIALRKRPGAVRSSAALLLPMAVAAAATLVYNARTFGSPLRNGYHFWTAVPSDYPAMVFSLSNAPQTLIGMTHTPFLLFVAISAGAWLVLRARQKTTDAAAKQALFDVLTFVVLVTIPIFLFHLFYFFADDRFHLPMLTGSAVIAGSTLGILIEERRAGIFKILLPALLLLAVTWRIVVPDSKPERRMAADLVRGQTPSNAIIISRIDPVYLDRLAARGSLRKIVPLSRRVEYASKLLVRKRISNPQPAPKDWHDQRAEGLLRGGAEEAVLFVAEELVSELVTEAAKGTPVFLESSALRGRRDGQIVTQLQGRFEFIERAPNLHELRPR